MENQIVVIAVSELKNIINESITNAVFKTPQKKDEEEILLKRKDVAKLFSVSLVTITDWMKTGKLPYHRINSRVFFKKNEVMKAMEIKQKYKRVHK